MKVGDLVRVLVGMRARKKDYPLGVIVGFDADSDPIVAIQNIGREPHYRKHIEVINES